MHGNVFFKKNISNLEWFFVALEGFICCLVYHDLGKWFRFILYFFAVCKVHHDQVKGDYFCKKLPFFYLVVPSPEELALCPPAPWSRSSCPSGPRPRPYYKCQLMHLICGNLVFNKKNVKKCLTSMTLSGRWAPGRQTWQSVKRKFWVFFSSLTIFKLFKTLFSVA